MDITTNTYDMGVGNNDVSTFGQNLSLSSSLNNSISNPNVADADFDAEIRIIVLYIEVILGALGGCGVLLWLWHNRRRKSRINLLILHVAVSDLLVIFCACLPQLVWEYYGRNWKAGVVMCKLIKFVQSFSMMASNNMLVVLSIDRMLAIRWPLRSPINVWKMTGIGWAIAALLSLPQVGVFHLHHVTDPDSRFFNMLLCESIWRLRPHYERQIYLSFIGFVVFEVPFIIIMICYVSIFLKISQKAAEASSSKKQNCKPGKVHLQSTTGNSSLSKAKIKTMKMTIVILSAFIICGFPYHVLEAIYNFGDHSSVPPVVSAIIGAMAVANSAVNPFVFLLFNANGKCAEGVLHCCKPHDRRGYYESTVGMRSEYTTDNARITTDNCTGNNGKARQQTAAGRVADGAGGQTECMRLSPIKVGEYNRVANEEQMKEGVLQQN